MFNFSWTYGPNLILSCAHGVAEYLLDNLTPIEYHLYPSLTYERSYIEVRICPDGPVVDNPNLVAIDYEKDIALLISDKITAEAYMGISEHPDQHPLKHIEYLYYIGFINKTIDARTQDYLGNTVSREEFLQIFGPTNFHPNLIGYSKQGILYDHNAQVNSLLQAETDTLKQRVDELYGGNICDYYDDKKLKV
ncbi:unnamed protein product [Didymodactylos carnosus]|uniref:Uncharacterized protein n=1 Tax=Didymodactylos carnosus TaxID=1234261 RepID=A0A8S2ESY0_9BILA|nr:unnamed protein product [Didymodactylos carnosus]CAF4037626.1 unnamed protein product [Didymodactylos carnosus]